MNRLDVWKGDAVPSFTSTAKSTVASAAIPRIGSTFGTRARNVPNFATTVAFLARTAREAAASVAATNVLVTVARLCKGYRQRWSVDKPTDSRGEIRTM